MIVIDQMRASYIERWSDLYHSGLVRLRDDGVLFTEAHHDHAVTTTAPGHATLATGLYPSHHGIIDNYWVDRSSGQRVYAVADRKDGRSPRKLLAPTLGDRMKSAWPASRLFGIGGKDRSAILSAGRRADAAYWFDAEEGTFGTSTYYAKETPAWLEAWNGERRVDRLFGTAWEPILPEEELLRHGTVPVDWGWLESRFPHPLGGLSAYPDEGYYESIAESPFLDTFVVELAKALIEAEQLGQDGFPDFLAITLSSLDTVGHTYGPDSPEVLDCLLRLDQTLGDLLSWLEDRIGESHLLVTLSSDHGVGTVPELLRQQGIDAKRIGREEILCFQGLGRELRQRFGDEQWLLDGLYLDHGLIEEKGLSVPAIASAAAEYLTTCPRVERIIEARSLSPSADLGTLAPIERLYANSYHPERSGDLLLVPQENTLFSRSMMASHGLPYPYDTHVPWWLLLPSGERAHVADRVATVDVAATLAALLNLPWEGRRDGVDRTPLLPRAERSVTSSGGL
jgi:arylsulfatase A-like enzyme